MEPPGRLPLRRFPGLVVEPPPGVVPPVLLGGRESLAAVVAHEPRRPREAEAFPLPLFDLKEKQQREMSNSAREDGCKTIANI